MNIFLSLDFFVFFIFYEAIIIPMFFLIGVWGSRKRKIYAAFQLYIYTLLGSVFVLLALLLLYFSLGISSFVFLFLTYFFFKKEFFIFFCLFVGFAVKIPMLPLHIWLPEAHVEAPAPGSVLLAAIVLKLGSYAMFRSLLSVFHFVIFDIMLLLMLFIFLGFVYPSFVALNQIDIKKIVAYSSVAHMNFSLMGMFSMSLFGLAGFYVQSIGHALTSGALFFGIGCLYDRYKTRLVFSYGGLVVFMPLLSFLFMLYILSNFAFPGTVNFVGEFLLSVGIYSCCDVFLFVSFVGLLLALIYSLFLYNRIFFYSIKMPFIRYFSDIIRLEFFVLFFLAFFVFYLGFVPVPIFDISQLSLIRVLN